jgi:hypothetical protein
MNSYAAGVTAVIGESWHVLATIIEDTGAAIVDTARAAAHIAWLVEVKYPLAAIQWGVAHAGKRVTIVQRTYPTVVREIKVSRKALGAAVAAAVATALVAKHLVITTIHDVRVLPARIGYTAKHIRHALARLTRLERITAGLGAVALVTAALARMGLGWLKCPALGRMGKKYGCGGFHALEKVLESLLGLAIDALVITDLCQITKLLTVVAGETEPVIGKLTSGIVSLMECQGTSRPATLNVNAVSLPPVTASTISL